MSINISHGIYPAVFGGKIRGMRNRRAINAARYLRGFNKDKFGGLCRSPWGGPAVAVMAPSLVLFGFPGDISGLVLVTAQVNLLAHNVICAPDRSHATVIAGTTLVLTAPTYLVMPLLFTRMGRPANPNLCDLRRQNFTAHNKGRPAHGCQAPMRHHLQRSDARLRLYGHALLDGGVERHRRFRGRGRQSWSAFSSWPLCPVILSTGNFRSKSGRRPMPGL